MQARTKKKKQLLTFDQLLTELPDLILKLELESQKLILDRIKSGELVNVDFIPLRISSEQLAKQYHISIHQLLMGYTQSPHYSLIESSTDFENLQEDSAIRYTYRLLPGHQATDMLDDLLFTPNIRTIIAGAAPITITCYYVLFRLFATYFPNLDYKEYFNGYFNEPEHAMLISIQPPLKGSRQDCLSFHGRYLPYNPINFFLNAAAEVSSLKGDLSFFCNLSSSEIRNNTFKGVKTYPLICVEDKDEPRYRGFHETGAEYTELQLTDMARKSYQSLKNTTPLSILGFQLHYRFNLFGLASCILMPQASLDRFKCANNLERAASSEIRMAYDMNIPININQVSPFENIDYLTAQLESNFSQATLAYFAEQFDPATDCFYYYLVLCMCLYHYHEHRDPAQSNEEQRSNLYSLHKKLAYATNNLAAAYLSLNNYELSLAYLQQAHQIFVACFQDEPERLKISQANIKLVTSLLEQHQAAVKQPVTQNSSTLFSKNQMKKAKRRNLQVRASSEDVSVPALSHSVS